MNISLHDAIWKRATYRERARTNCRRPTRYQWYLNERPARPLRFSSASNPLRLKLEQVGPRSGCGPNRRPRRGSKPLSTSHLLVRLSVWGRPKQCAKTILRVCYFELLFSRVVVAICLSGRSLFHDLRSLAACDGRTGARESDLETMPTRGVRRAANEFVVERKGTRPPSVNHQQRKCSRL